MNLHTYDYLAYSVNEVVIILDLDPMDVLCSFCRIQLFSFKSAR
jgi:hypothetical protein